MASGDRFLRTELLLGKDNLEKLRRAKVAVIGLGAVGSFVCEALVRSGVGSLCLVDFDKIAISNINRNLLATEGSLKKYKVDVAKERYLEINPEVNIETYNAFMSKDEFKIILESKPNVIIDAIDAVNPKVQVLEEACKTDIPIISSMGAALKVDPSLVRVGSIFETKNCTLAKWVRKHLRKRGIDRDILCVYSKELPNCEAIFDTDFLNEEREYDRGRERQTMGSMIVIPGIFGLTIAKLAIDKILAEV
ncbi:MAG: tRNA threonylcarbamoyladenosine dehydratase [Bdellovibrionota bacterium]